MELITLGLAMGAAVLAPNAGGQDDVSDKAGVAVLAASAVQSSADAIIPKIANDPSAPTVNGAKAKLVDDPKAQGGKALRVVVRKKAANIWDSSVESMLTKPLVKGDKLILMFEARLHEGPDGATSASIPNAAIQMASAPYTTLGSGQPALTGEWKSFRYEGVADKDYAAGAVKATIHIGNTKQVVDFGPIIVLNMGQ